MGQGEWIFPEVLRWEELADSSVQDRAHYEGVVAVSCGEGGYCGAD